MDLHELQKMISIIHDKKPRCRGNLRVKVLLKSTHDYVRRSLLDDQLGNSERLLTLLRNSGTVREPLSPVHSSHETDLHSMNSDEICPAVNTDSMDCDHLYAQPISQCTTYMGNDKELLCSESTTQNMLYFSKNIIIPMTIEALANFNQTLNNIPAQPAISDQPKNGDAFKNSNKSSDKYTCSKSEEKYSKLIKALRRTTKHWKILAKTKSDKSCSNPYSRSVKRMRKLLLYSQVRFKADFKNQSFSRRKRTKHWEVLSKAKSDKSCSKHYSHSVKRIRKLLLKSKVCLKADLENQSLSQQRIIQMYVREVKKMLKQCDKVLEHKSKIKVVLN